MRIKTWEKTSVIIATYNSERHLEEVLRSVRRQDYPQDKVEILIVDGGSKDATIDIAKKFRCKIFKNPKVLQVFGKQIGALKAKGKYLVFLDSDEVLVDRNSFNKKIETFNLNKKVKAVFPTGIVTPSDISSANHIINDFGEPFSYFIYRASTHPDFLIPQTRKVASIVYEDRDRIIVDFSKTSVFPPIELSAIGIAVEKKWLFDTFPDLKNDPALVSQSFFYLVRQKGLLGITKDDLVIHYSSPGWIKYLRKIKSRVINNVYKTKMGMSAFSGREEFYPPWMRIKKYIFILYSLTILPAFIDSIYLAITRKQIVYLSYPIICIYTSILIMFYYLLKALGVKKKVAVWGA